MNSGVKVSFLFSHITLFPYVTILTLIILALTKFLFLLRIYTQPAASSKPLHFHSFSPTPFGNSCSLTSCSFQVYHLTTFSLFSSLSFSSVTFQPSCCFLRKRKTKVENFQILCIQVQHLSSTLFHCVRFIQLFLTLFNQKCRSSSFQLPAKLCKLSPFHSFGGVGFILWTCYLEPIATFKLPFRDTILLFLIKV